MGKEKVALVKKEYVVPFILITSLFFMWGFARSILDVLNKHFQDAMSLSRTESTLIQVCVYSAYFLIAVPAGLYINKRGYRNGVVFGLILFAIGSLLFIPSEFMMSYPSFLVALFVIGCGLVFLETAANPYATKLGDPRTAASRLNLAQSFNGLGCVFGPAIMGSILFSEQGDGRVAVPYTVMGVIVLIVAYIFSRSKLPEIKMNDAAGENDNNQSVRGLWRRHRFTFGLIALFCYEISEISINSLFVNYATDDGWLNKEEASYLLSFGALMLFMLARVVGSFVMSKIKAEIVLFVCAIMTVLGALLVMLNVGVMSKVGLFACYAFEAIMFPTIFAISLRGLGDYYTKRAASFLMMTPIGGAVGTFLMGVTADATTMSFAFIVPLIGYAVVMIYSYFAMSNKLK